MALSEATQKALQQATHAGRTERERVTKRAAAIALMNYGDLYGYSSEAWATSVLLGELETGKTPAFPLKDGRRIVYAGRYYIEPENGTQEAGE